MKAQLRDFLEYLRLTRNASAHTVAAYDGDIGPSLEVSPKREHKIPSHLSVDEMARLLDTPDVSEPLGVRDRAILELFFASGLRLSELVGLDIEDVNLSARMV